MYQIRAPILAACSLFAVLLAFGARPASADVDCKFLAPPGTSVTKEGEVQATVAATAILKSVRGNVDVKVSGKDSLQTAQQNSPTDDPQALKARTLYIFCGMIANATDIKSERKFEMLMQLQEVKPPPAAKPKSKPETVGGTSVPKAAEVTHDIAAILGMPPLASSRQNVARFAASRQGEWSTSDDNHEFVRFQGSLNGKPATANLFIDEDKKLFAVQWKIEGKRNEGGNVDNPWRDVAGPDPSSLCNDFINEVVNFFVKKADVTPGPVSVGRPQVQDAWTLIPGGQPYSCRLRSGACHATGTVVDRKTVLTRDDQKVTIRAVAVDANSYFDAVTNQYKNVVAKCTFTATIQADA